MSDEIKKDIPENIMEKINSGEARMRPKWEFVAASVTLLAGFFGLAFLTTFLVSLMTFSLRSHGPMGNYRFTQLIEAFPWWALVLAVFCFLGGVYLLRQYDFSYKKNFLLIIAGFALAVLAIGYFVNTLGLDRSWRQRGGMHRFYQQYDGGQTRPRMDQRGPNFFIR